MNEEFAARTEEEIPVTISDYMDELSIAMAVGMYAAMEAFGIEATRQNMEAVGEVYHRLSQEESPRGNIAAAVGCWQVAKNAAAGAYN